MKNVLFAGIHSRKGKFRITLMTDFSHGVTTTVVQENEQNQSSVFSIKNQPFWSEVYVQVQL